MDLDKCPAEEHILRAQEKLKQFDLKETDRVKTRNELKFILPKVPS